MTTSELITLLSNHLSPLYDSRELEAIIRAVFEDVLHYSPVDMVLRENFEQDDVFVDKIKHIAMRLKEHEPLQYVLGHASFHGHDFVVTPATLIPRPETERLVDMIVDEHGSQPDLKVLDMGTGSGCIAISLARALKFAHVVGLDVSSEALKVAQANGKALHAPVDWLCDDMLTACPPHEVYDIVVSNPPYVLESEKSEIEPHVLNHEPAQALFVPNDDPLKFYRAITIYASQALKSGGKLYLEINRRFGTEIQSLLESAGFDDVCISCDQFGQVRFATCMK